MAIPTGTTFSFGRSPSLTDKAGTVARDYGARVTRACMPDLQTAVSRSGHNQRQGKVRKGFAKLGGIAFTTRPRHKRLTLLNAARVRASPSR